MGIHFIAIPIMYQPINFILSIKVTGQSSSEIFVIKTNLVQQGIYQTNYVELLKYHRYDRETRHSSAIDPHAWIHLTEPCISFCQAVSQLYNLYWSHA